VSLRGDYRWVEAEASAPFSDASFSNSTEKNFQATIGMVTAQPATPIANSTVSTLTRM
jgi:hypothetical protein